MTDENIFQMEIPYDENPESSQDNKEKEDTSKESIQTLAEVQNNDINTNLKSDYESENTLLKVKEEDAKQARLIWALLQKEPGNQAGWWKIFKEAERYGAMNAKETRKIIDAYCKAVEKHKGKNSYKWNEKYAVPDLEEPEFPSIDTIIGVKTTATKPDIAKDDEDEDKIHWWLNY